MLNFSAVTHNLSVPLLRLQCYHILNCGLLHNDRIVVPIQWRTRYSYWLPIFDNTLYYCEFQFQVNNYLFLYYSYFLRIQPHLRRDSIMYLHLVYGRIVCFPHCLMCIKYTSTTVVLIITVNYLLDHIEGHAIHKSIQFQKTGSRITEQPNPGIAGIALAQIMKPKHWTSRTKEFFSIPLDWMWPVNR